MQVKPHVYSELGILMINIFRYLLLYCILLNICKYFIHHFDVIHVFCNVLTLELIN